MKLTMTRMFKDIVVDRKLHFIEYSESVRVRNRYVTRKIMKGGTINRWLG